MKIKVKNLGVLKQAEFTLGDLTIICGENNSGKTYATYALFGFLDTWREYVAVGIPSGSIEQLLAQGVVKIDMENTGNIESIVADACSNYTKNLSNIFASSENRFNETEFQISIEIGYMDFKDRVTHAKIFSPDGKSIFFSIDKDKESTEITVTSIATELVNKIPFNTAKNLIEALITNIIFLPIFPRVFIASVERTGAAIFRKDLSLSRDILVERLIETDRESGTNVDLRKILRSRYQNYPLPVKKNIDFMRNLENVFKQSSFIAKEHPDILADFADIIGGEYTVTREDELYYIPKQGKRIRLPMDGSSSAVRSLLDIGFYLKHEAQPGDILMIDEPELNLHPENQRRVARLFARLINIGIKVFITTHSDYIIKELNALIMLNHDRPHLKQLAEDEGYLPAELLSADRIKVYIAEEALVKVDGKTRKVKCQTLTEAKIDSERGIEARSFDKTIDDMNRIQDAIVWGGE
jgi:AAA15 family ATPase/GTPase